MKPEDMNLSLGYLLDGEEHGIYSTEGRVEGYTPEDAEVHNKLLSQAEIEGMDHAEIGQGCLFYVAKNDQIQTWIGEPIGETVSVISKSHKRYVYTVKHGDRTFVGTFAPEDPLDTFIFMERTA